MRRETANGSSIPSHSESEQGDDKFRACPSGLDLRPWEDDSEGHLRRKRNHNPHTASLSKRHKSGKDSDSESEPGIPNFDPAAIVQPKDGTRQVPKPIRKYLTKNWQHCFTKEERSPLYRTSPTQIGRHHHPEGGQTHGGFFGNETSQGARQPAVKNSDSSLGLHLPTHP